MLRQQQQTLGPSSLPIGWFGAISSPVPGLISLASSNTSTKPDESRSLGPGGSDQRSRGEELPRLPAMMADSYLVVPSHDLIDHDHDQAKVSFTSRRHLLLSSPGPNNNCMRKPPQVENRKREENKAQQMLWAIIVDGREFSQHSFP